MADTQNQTVDTQNQTVFQKLFGDELLQGDKTVKTADLDFASKKVVCIYFSAHWCPPCRGFTPKLAEWYKNDLQKKGVEVVFVSSDRDEDAFKEYYKEMPWLALPYSNRDAKGALSKKFKCQGIPHLVVLDAKTGKTITLDGRSKITQDPKGEELPWTPKPLKELLGNEFVNEKLKKVDAKAAFGSKKYLGLYFSAHWCPPCQAFTPKLADVYKKLVKNDKDCLEVIFLSSDSDDKSFKSYFKSMPWLALPYDARKQKEALSSHFDVSGIPTFILLDAQTLEVVSERAAGPIRSQTADKAVEAFPWVPPAVAEIDEDPSGIDENPALVCVMESCTPEEQKAMKEAIETIAKNYIEQYKAEIKKENDDAIKFNFFTATKDGRLAERVRSECNLGKAGDEKNKQPRCVIMDIPDNGAYYGWEQGDVVNSDTIRNFLESYKAKHGQAVESEQVKALRRSQMGEAAEN